MTMFASEQTDGNLSQLASDYLQSVNLGNSAESAASLWLHALAIGYSSANLKENADGSRMIASSSVSATSHMAYCP